MVMVDCWLLLDGIEEVLFLEVVCIEVVCCQVLDLFYCWGYEFVVILYIEYLELLFIGVGQDFDLCIFKVIDLVFGWFMGFCVDIML